jgi:hypothetical protein
VFVGRRTTFACPNAASPHTEVPAQESMHGSTVADTTAFQDAPTPVKTKKKSLRSVCFTSADFVLDVVDFSWLEKASCILEAKLSKPIS